MLKPPGIIPSIKLKLNAMSMHLGRYKEEKTRAFFRNSILLTVTHSSCEEQEKVPVQAIQRVLQQDWTCTSEGSKEKKNTQTPK